jgi:hypothetical protein
LSLLMWFFPLVSASYRILKEQCVFKTFLQKNT